MKENTLVAIVLVVFLVTVFGGMFSGMAYQQYTKNECRKTYANSIRTADEILKICQ
jgi:preprotein translocase subunit YajC